MAMSYGSAKGRTLAETLEKAAGYLSDKEMPRAMVPAAGRRYSPRPPQRPNPVDRTSSNDNGKE